MRLFRVCLAAVIAVFALGAQAATIESAGPRVLVSIKPIHSIVASVMQGVTQPDVLLRGAASPHTYQLTALESQRLSSNDVIFWVGPALEKFLEAPLDNLPPGTRVIALAEIKGIKLLPVRRGDLWETDPDASSPGGVDGHIWLDPNNAIAIARSVAGTLSEIDPAHAVLYAGNTKAFVDRLTLLDARLAEQVAPALGKPYIVFHDAYAYFEDHYGLTPVGSIAVALQRPIDPRRIAELKARIRGSDSFCILSGRELSSQLIESLTVGTRARATAVEDLGANIPAGPLLYQTLMSRIAGALASCAGP